MAMMNKVLKGLGKAGKALTVENRIDNGGGLSSLLVPRMVSGPGAALIVGGGAALSFGNEAIKGHNTAKLGRISYGDGMARMTKSYTTGAVQVMRAASDGNYAAFADMAEETVTSYKPLGMIDDYGATPALVSALYGMGGR